MHPTQLSIRVCLATFIVAFAGTRGVAQPSIDVAKLQTEAVQRTREYLRINTTNPPGNESETMKWFARILAQEGIAFDTASSAPGRGNIWARLKGTGTQPALVLLHHMNVVPADPKYWTTDPYAATTKDSVIFGRGALDTKTLGVVELEAFLALHRAKIPLDRDVIFMATADEEAGGNFGAGWVVKHQPEAFKGAGRPAEDHRRPQHADGAADREAGIGGTASEHVFDHHASGEQQDQRHSARGRGADRLPPST